VPDQPPDRLRAIHVANNRMGACAVLQDTCDMTGRLSVVVLAVAGGVIGASLIPQIPLAVRNLVGLATGTEPMAADGPRDGAAARNPPGESRAEGAEAPPASIKLTDDQIEAVGIELAPVQDGTLAHRITVPGTIEPHADRIARVSVRLFATVVELRKKLGDMVAKDEVVAVLDSREVANAKSEYLAARLTSELSKDLYDRDKEMWDRRVMAEQQVLRSRNTLAQARMNVDIARQKLFAIGLTETEIAALPQQPEASLRLQAVQSPISGRVVDRKVDLGAAVGRDQLAAELFTVADLDRVWVELAVSPTDLPLVQEGQTVSVAAHGLAYRAIGTIVFISPMLDRETHSARVVAEIANPDGNWRPGSLVHCTIAIEERSLPLTVPASAVQTIGKTQVVFVRTPGVFEKRPVTLGQSDDRISEVITGVRAGETIAVTNTFMLKAEFLKGLAED
jgi:cobalt-zinc-cadmium efflux system membrane fusion protein